MYNVKEKAICTSVHTHSYLRKSLTLPDMLVTDFHSNKCNLLYADNGEDDLVQLAVGQCPRKCIYYMTPCQRAILEDILAR
jgi:prepilin-type processing-associated H-X9-DG protein